MCMDFSTILCFPLYTYITHLLHTSAVFPPLHCVLFPDVPPPSGLLERQSPREGCRRSRGGRAAVGREISSYSGLQGDRYHI